MEDKKIFWKKRINLLKEIERERRKFFKKQIQKPTLNIEKIIATLTKRNLTFEFMKRFKKERKEKQNGNKE